VEGDIVLLKNRYIICLKRQQKLVTKYGRSLIIYFNKVIDIHVEGANYKIN